MFPSISLKVIAHNHLKFVYTKNTSKYLIGYLEEVIRPLVLTLPKINKYIKISKDKGGDKFKNHTLVSYVQMMINY